MQRNNKDYTTYELKYYLNPRYETAKYNSNRTLGNDSIIIHTDANMAIKGKWNLDVMYNNQENKILAEGT